MILCNGVTNSIHLHSFGMTERMHETLSGSRLWLHFVTNFYCCILRFNYNIGRFQKPQKGIILVWNAYL